VHRRRAGAVRLADGAVPVLGVPDVRGVPARRVEPAERLRRHRVETGTNNPAELQTHIDGLREARAELDPGNPAGPILNEQIAGLERQIAEAVEPSASQPEVLAQSEDSGRLTARRTGW